MATRITRTELVVNSHTGDRDYRTLYFETEADAAAYDAACCPIPPRSSGLDMNKAREAQAQADAIRNSFRK